MQKLIITFLLAGLLVSRLFAQNFAQKSEKVSILPPASSLILGERLEYDMLWLGIPVGNIVLSVVGIEKVNGKDAYHLRGEAKPNDFFAALYDMDYKVDSYMDTTSYCTLRLEKTQTLRGKTTKEEIVFDPKSSSPAHPAKCSQDLLTTIYYLRLKNIKEDSSFELPAYYNSKSWITRVRIKSAFCKDYPKKCEFNVFDVSIDSQLNEPLLGMREISGLMSADSRRLPLEFRLGSGIGSFTGKIRAIYPPNG